MAAVMQSKTVLLVILVVALLARALFSVGVVGLDAMTKGDEADYHAIAVNLATGEGFAGEDGKITGRRPPLFPFLLSILYRVAGPSAALARVIQILLGVVVVYLVYLVARRYFTERVALTAAAIAAINPFLTFICGYLLTENLFVILVFGAILSLPLPGKAVSPRSVIAASALLGFATLARPTGLPLAAWVFLAALILGKGTPQTKLRRFAIAMAVFLAVTTPWMLRNASVFGGWVGLTTHGGITFYQGNNEKVVEVEHYRGGVAPVGALPRYQEFATMNELERDQFTSRAGKEFLRENPGVVPKLVWWKFKRLWRLHSDMGLSGIRSGWWFDRNSTLGRIAADFDTGLVYAVVVFPLFLAGLWVTRSRWRELAYLYGIVVVHTAVALAFFGSIRGRLPIEPVIAVFAGAAIIHLVDVVRSRGKQGDRLHSEPEQG